MANRMSGLAVLVVATMILLVAGAGAQARDNCTLAYSSLAPCLSYVQGNDTTPSPQCCGGISYLNTNVADCLCQIVNSGSNTSNATKAFGLPSQCGVVVKCFEFTVSVRAGSTPSTPSRPSTPVTTPSRPVTPVTPSRPVTPVTPSRPVTPVTPSQPVTPVTPSRPVTPVPGGGTQPSPVIDSDPAGRSAAPHVNMDFSVAFTALLAVTHLLLIS